MTGREDGTRTEMTVAKIGGGEREGGRGIVGATGSEIRNLIYTVRGRQVMLDSDLARLYGVETKVFNQAVGRNSKRFPERFRFQLTQEEAESLRSQIVTSNESGRGGRRYPPYVFTEQGGYRCSRRCYAATQPSRSASESSTASSRCATSSRTTPPCSSRYAPWSCASSSTRGRCHLGRRLGSPQEAAGATPVFRLPAFSSVRSGSGQAAIDWSTHTATNVLDW